jgi:segregation and condensation protein A
MNPSPAVATVTPAARVHGEVFQLPEDLYIPPDSLQVFLETFEGPLDLLLYLIKKQNINILDIPIAKITLQYMEYVDFMCGLRLELAAEYLLMAAMLAEIKSRMLLPRAEPEQVMDDDPRADLVRRLQAYEQFKKAAARLDSLPQLGREVFLAQADYSTIPIKKVLPDVTLQDLLMALSDVFKRADLNTHHQVQLEPLSVRERMSHILTRLSAGSFSEFASLFDPKEGRLGVIVTFLALLELVKDSLIELVQSTPGSMIHIKQASAKAVTP